MAALDSHPVTMVCCAKKPFEHAELSTRQRNIKIGTRKDGFVMLGRQNKCSYWRLASLRNEGRGPILRMVSARVLTLASLKSKR